MRPLAKLALSAILAAGLIAPVASLCNAEPGESTVAINDPQRVQSEVHDKICQLKIQIQSVLSAAESRAAQLSEKLVSVEKQTSTNLNQLQADIRQIKEQVFALDLQQKVTLEGTRTLSAEAVRSASGWASQQLVIAGGAHWVCYTSGDASWLCQLYKYQQGCKRNCRSQTKNCRNEASCGKRGCKRL